MGTMDALCPSSDVVVLIPRFLAVAEANVYLSTNSEKIILRISKLIKMHMC